MVEHGADPLLPLAALIHQRVTQPDLGTQIEDVIGRNPALRQPPGHQQLAQMLGVGPVALGVLLGAAQRAGLRRLSEMHLRSDGPQLLDHEPPSRRGLQRHLERPAGEPLKEPAHAARSAGATRVREISPVSVSIHSAVICARC